jgi:hypothetical protein
MTHSFEVEIAQLVGLEEAIMLQHFEYWDAKNRANGKHEMDGHFWTYNSVKGFSAIFPYLGEKAMRRILEKLEGEGIIITGNYNPKPYDRTKWYALTEKGKWICRKGQMDLPKRANGFAEKGKPIPVSNTDSNTDTHAQSEKKETEFSLLDFIEIANKFCLEEKETVRSYCEIARFEGSVKEQAANFCSYYMRERSVKITASSAKNFFSSGFLRWLQSAKTMPEKTTKTQSAAKSKIIDPKRYAEYE